MNIIRRLFQLIVPTGRFCWYSPLPPDKLLAHIRNSHALAPPSRSPIKSLFLASELKFLTSVTDCHFTLEAVLNSNTKLYFTGTVSEYGEGSILQGTFTNKGDRLFSAIGYAAVALGYLALSMTDRHWPKDNSAELLRAGLIFLSLALLVPRMRFHASKRALLQTVEKLLDVQEQPVIAMAALGINPH